MRKPQFKWFDRTRTGAFILLGFALLYGWLSQDIPNIENYAVNGGLQARSLPTFLAVAAIVLASLILWRGEGDKRSNAPVPLAWSKIIAFLALMSLFGWAIRPLGFLPATALFLFSGFYLMGQRRILFLAACAVIAALTGWVLLSYGLGIYIAPLPDLLTALQPHFNERIHRGQLCSMA